MALLRDKGRTGRSEQGGAQSLTRRRLLACLLLLAGLLLFTRGDAAAQSKDAPAFLILGDENPVADLGPYLYVTRDPDSSLSFNAIYDRYNSGWRGDTISGNVLPLGGSAIPHWIIFSVYNQSSTDKWVISFGQHLTGRIGQLKKVFLYDRASGITYLDNTRAGENPYVGNEGQGGAEVSVTIPRGKQAMFFMYVIPHPGMTATLAPTLMTEQIFARRISDPLQPARLVNFFFAVMAGFFIAVILFTRYWGAAFFLLYYAAQIMLFNYQNGTLFSASALSSDIAGLLTAAGTIAGLFMAQSFFDIGRGDHLQNRLILIFAAGNALVTAAASVMFRGSGLYHVVVIAPAIASQIFLIMLSLAQGYSRRPGAYSFALGWVFALAGLCVTLLGIVNILPQTPYLLAGCWYALAPQGVAFIAATMGRSAAAAYDSEMREMDEGEDQEKVAALKQNKEVQENQRLRRLIEHERQVMTELRDRESKQNDEMRKAMSLADDANRAKSAFLAVISHEIRTPMSGIMGMVRLLLETTLNTNQRDYAQTIQDSGDAMLALLNDILDFEKIESGKMDLEHIDFDVHRLMNGITTLMTGHASAKKIALKVELGENLPRFMIGDPVRLRQVLLNLTGNSIKFTAQGGVTLRVKLETSAEEKAMAAHKMHRIRFGVEDTGVGISPDAQKNLFNPFAQADSSVARKFGGTGLGLAISQRLIEAMGGKIKIDSTEGRGSIFYFVLAMEEGNVDALKDRQASGQVAAQKSERSLDILIVDDNEINQKLLREFVDRMGHRTSLAGSGEDALEIMKKKPFDMVLMDIELPGMSGMGTTKAIRALPDRKAAATPVIALTGNVREEDIRTCFAANMNGHLAKPVDPKRLKGMIDKVIKGALDNPAQLAEAASADFVATNRLGGGARPAAAVNAPIVNTPASRAPAAVQASVVAAAAPPIVRVAASASAASAPQAVKAAAQPSAVQAGNMPPIAKAAAAAAAAAEQPSAIAMGKAAGDDFTVYEKKPAPPVRDTVSPIRELALNMEHLKPTDDELNSDSFADAIGAGEITERSPAPATAAAGPADVFDQAMLGDLRKSIDPKSFDDMIKGLLDKADEIVVALGQAAAAGDQKSMTARAHELKGMAANFGLKELAGVAGQAEKALKENQTAGLNDLLTALPAANRRAREALQSWMKT